jgi:hypothetical protein
MTKRTTIVALIVLCLSALFIVVRPLVDAPEPSYNGKTLTQWLIEMQGQGINDRIKYDECREAIYVIGTNAVPTLVQMVNRTDSPLKVKVIEFLGPKWSDRLKIRSAEYYQSKATFGFSSLREKSAPAVHPLIALLHSNNRGLQTAAAECLSDIGSEAGLATQDLVQLLHNTTSNDATLILSAMDGLRGSGRNPKVAVPELLIWINGERKSWNFVQHAVEALWPYGPSAKAAVPALQSLLNDPDPNLSNAAFHSLFMIDREVAEKWQRDQWAKRKQQ